MKSNYLNPKLSMILSVLCFALLSGCASSDVLIATNTIFPTVFPATTTFTVTPTLIPTPTPTLTLTATPTNTPLPTSTPTPAFPLTEGDMIPEGIPVLNPSNISEIKELARFGSGVILDVKLSPDGDQVIIDHSTGLFKLDPVSLQATRILNANIPTSRDRSTGNFTALPYSCNSVSGLCAVLNGTSILVFGDKSEFPTQVIEIQDQLESAQIINYNKLELAPDGKTIALSGDLTYLYGDITHSQGMDYLIWLWNLEDGKLLLRQQGSQYDFSPDSSIFATGGFNARENKIILWNTNDGSRIGTIGPIQHSYFTFSPSGRWIVGCSGFYSGGRVFLWESDDWSLIGQYTFDASNIQNYCPVKFDNEEKVIVSWGVIIDIQTETMSSLPNQRNILLSPDGNRLLSYEYIPNTDAARRGLLYINLWDPNDNRKISTYLDNTYGYNATFSIDGTRFVIPDTAQNETLLLNSDDGALVATLKGIRPIFLPDHKSIITFDGSIINKWDIVNGTLIISSPLFESLLTDNVVKIIFSPDGEYFAGLHTPKSPWTGGWLSVVQMRGLSSRKVFADQVSIRDFAIFSDGKMIAAISGESIDLRELNGNTRQKIEDVGAGLLAISPAGDFLATIHYPSAYESEIFLWDLASGEKIKTVPVSGYIQNPIFDGEVLTGTVIDFKKGTQMLTRWKLFDGQILQRSNMDSYYYPFTISMDQQKLAYVYEGFVSIVDPETFDQYQSFKIQEIPIFLRSVRGAKMAFSPDDQIIATAIMGGTVELWDTSTGNLIHTIKDNTLDESYSTNVALAFSPDGRYIITSGNGIFHLWGLMP